MDEDYTKVDLDEREAGAERAPEPPPPGPGTPDDRDPRGINQHLKVVFEELLAEPSSTHSFDKVWAGSHVSFEVCRLWGYRILSVLCAVPASILTGFLFALITCLHIWCLVPCVRICLLGRPHCQSICHSLTDIIVTPLCTSMGRCFRRVHLRVAKY
uniref:caveolin-2 n=1 Tax=Pristiophorus japonicus TaxID=55135 RepID=UPI00398E3E7A